MNLVLGTTQKLLMSQNMLQSTSILQMSTPELMEYVNRLTEENPVLEVKKDFEDEQVFNALKRKIDYLDSSDEQNRIYYSEERDDEEENDDWKFKQEEGKTLYDFILEQVNVLKYDESLISICDFIAGSLDENGYLKYDAEDIAGFLGISQIKAQEAVDIIKSLEPAGVGASGVKECLKIQAERLGIFNGILKNIIEDCLEMVGKNQIGAIAKKLKQPQDDIIEAINTIKSLNPRPSSGFMSGDRFEYITPDAVISGENGKYSVIMNEYFTADVKLNRFYKDIIKNGDNAEAKEYIYSKIRQAQWVVKCISKRSETLYKIICAIVERQTEFFDLGRGHIKPLSLGSVADVVGIHESTASRAVKGKYIQCRHGVYPLSYFLRQAAAESYQGDSLTQEKIQKMIKELIDNENKNSPLSDRKIADELLKEGVDISRRTVAKYRSAMGINGISGRKI